MSVTEIPKEFGPLREQLLAAAEAFSSASQPLGELLASLVDDVARAAREPLEIFPVCHHSPAAAIHMIARLRQRPPRVLFMEMCEDLRPILDKLRDCKLPVALQAYAGHSDTFPASWTPLSVVAPLTEFSAEYQAIVYCMENPSTELVFVDRAVDHVFQWMPQKADELEKHLAGEATEDGEPTEEGEASLPGHGAAIGVQMGNLEPTFDQFHDFLLRNARVRSFAEWWDQYVEQAVVSSDYATYRQVLFLVGSLLRRLGRKSDDLKTDRLRERFMWTRMKSYLAEHKIPPKEAMYVCGAAHSASDVEEYGTHNSNVWDIPERTTTKWLYGLIPSSYAAIDHQFHLPPGTVTLSEASWDKHRRALGVQEFRLPNKGGKSSPKAKKSPTAASGSSGVANLQGSAGSPEGVVSLEGFLTRPPALATEDEEQLLAWCVGITNLARRNGYLSTTADSIAVYHTSILLAQMRNRLHPTPYDFRDAAITCLEKDRTPRKRNITRLCDVLLGGDRLGQVGFTSLPPLAQDVYARLAPLQVNLQATSLQRALLDLRQSPELLPVSDLLWKLRYLLPQGIIRPIMGERVLGQKPVQESWDLGIGKHQTPLIELGYEGVTVEHVLEKRIKAKAFSADADAVQALAAAEDSELYLKSPRLTQEVGEQAVALLSQETGAQTAPEIFERVRQLIHYYRSTPTGLPEWCKRFVTTGYSHYSTLMPLAFADRGTTPDQVAGMLAFLFNLESLALSLGCQRSQLLIALHQSAAVADDPNKIGLLWSAEWVMGLRTVETIRTFFTNLLENRLALASFPAYVNGFLLALKFTPLVGRLVVELLTRAFEKLPDGVLLPWLPGLLMTLRPHQETVLPTLLKEAAHCFPAKWAVLQTWKAPWDVPTPAPVAPTKTTTVVSPEEKAAGILLRQEPEATEALGRLLGLEPIWPTETAVASSETTGPGNASEAGAISLLKDYPEALASLRTCLIS